MQSTLCYKSEIIQSIHLVSVVVRIIFSRYGEDDLCLSQYEFKLIEALCTFWANFEKITSILSGETYSTVNMACVFRSELASSLEEDENDLPEIVELKQNMRKNFDKRFPMSELISVGALLDPRCQNLVEVKNYLAANGTTSFELLKKLSQEFVHCCSSVPKPKNLNFVEELVERHSSLQFVKQTLRSESEVDREIYFLLSLAGNVEVDNIRMFWKSYAKQMPTLSILAKKVLCIPMTSTPSEGNFSIAGLIVNLRRSSLLPSNVNKILFIHNNYEFCKKIALNSLKIDDFQL